MSTNTVSEVKVSMLHHLQRRLDSSTPEMSFNNETTTWENDRSTNFTYGDFDPKLFWYVGGFFMGMLFSACLCCYLANMNWFTNTHASTDAEYQATLREREEQQRMAKIVTPEQRRKRLLESFARHNVTMEVTSHDMVRDEPTDSHNLKTSEKDVEADLTLGENKGQLRLTTGSLVPNCCAICLGEYDVGDKVVWSSNSDCNHAFHEDCILDWLIKMQPLTPCPCCRQEFTDLELVRKEKKITWSGGNAFNMSAVRF